MNRPGWIKLHRKLQDSAVFKNSKLLHFWIYCLVKATHKEFTAIVGFQSIVLRPGQFIFGLRVASKETGLTIQNLRTCTQFLTDTKNLTIKTTNKYSIITICNWEIYQGEDDEDQQANQQTSNKQITNNQQHTRIYKNIKKGKTLNLRKFSFARKLLRFKSKYTSVLLKEFYQHWTETNPGGSKMLFEMKKTFDVSRRLGTWNRNALDWGHESAINGEGGSNGELDSNAVIRDFFDNAHLYPTVHDAILGFGEKERMIIKTYLDKKKFPEDDYLKEPKDVLYEKVD